MSKEGRKLKLEECDKIYNTLQGLNKEDLIGFLEANVQPENWWGEKQEQAAKIVVKKIGIEIAARKIGVNPESEVLYACAVKRPSLIFDESNVNHYIKWRDINSKSPSLIAEEWILDLRRKGNRYLEAISSHIRCEDYSNKFFITSFKEGTVHQADGKGGDMFDNLDYYSNL